MTFKEFYTLRLDPPLNSGLDRDILEHLSLLEYLAHQCNHVTEFGTNNAHSTAAFLKGCIGRVISYDINRSKAVDQLSSMELPCQWEFHQRDTGDSSLEIEPTDFLFIDSYHEHEHCKKELSLHSSKVRHYIGFHDTVAFGEVSRYHGEPERKGIMPAIREFLAEHPEWVIKYELENCNGLMILERINV